jgi:hypothetical protein
MPEKAWAYYSSAADDEITQRENHAAYHRQAIELRPLRSSKLTDTQNLVPPSHSPECNEGGLVHNDFGSPIKYASLYCQFVFQDSAGDIDSSLRLPQLSENSVTPMAS